MTERTLEQMKNDLEIVRAEIKDAIENNKPMTYIQKLVNLDNKIGNLIQEKLA